MDYHINITHKALPFLKSAEMPCVGLYKLYNKV